jgi:hypothetical protein
MAGLAKGTGFLYVTDSRVVLFAYSSGFLFQRPSQLVQETKLSEITGINAYVTRRFSLALLGAAIILGIVGIFCIFTIFLIPIALILWAAALVCFIALLTGRGNVGANVIKIHSKHGVSPVHVGAGEGVSGSIGAVLGAVFHPWRLILGGTTAMDVTFFGRPGKDAEELVADLGALILDLQTRGETAAEYWQVPLTEPQAERGLVMG